MPAAFTTANGYKTAAAYENSQVVDSIGGGACASWLPLCIMLPGSGSEIVQRQNHHDCHLCETIQDAAIAGTCKDIKIKR